MPRVEVFEGSNPDKLAFVADFDSLPRVGEYLAKEAGGYFRYLNVVEVWHREDAVAHHFVACIRVEAEDEPVSPTEDPIS